MLDIYLCGDFGPEREKIQKQIEKKIRIHGTILWMNVWRLWIGSFIRTHRSYLVNRKKITEMDRRHNRIKVGDGVCLVSRKMKSVLLEKLDGGLV